ncbi:hypothetical protein KEM54_004171 [Ascosphaera aggregata]|nr:hypothetical protein KEM54_004171 [Ascosphaera aggregata]
MTLAGRSAKAYGSQLATRPASTALASDEVRRVPYCYEMSMYVLGVLLKMAFWHITNDSKVRHQRRNLSKTNAVLAYVLNCVWVTRATTLE